MGPRKVTSCRPEWQLLSASQHASPPPPLWCRAWRCLVAGAGLVTATGPCTAVLWTGCGDTGHNVCSAAILTPILVSSLANVSHGLSLSPPQQLVSALQPRPEECVGGEAAPAPAAGVRGRGRAGRHQRQSWSNLRSRQSRLPLLSGWQTPLHSLTSRQASHRTPLR